MKLKSMRSVLLLFFICVIIAGTATAYGNSVTEKMSATCTEDTFAAQPGVSVIAIVYTSGHGNTYIDGLTLVPDSTAQVSGYDANWYVATPGTHSILITGSGYINFISDTQVCKGKVSYVYYDQESHRALGTTPKETTITTVPTTTAVPTTTPLDGQSTDYGAIKGALGTKAPPGTYGSLSVSTDPNGATIYIDGVQLGISPATLPGLSAGTHTLLLKMDGYQDLSLPVVISAGTTHSYSSAMLKSGTAPGVTAGTTTTRKSSAPGFVAAFAACIVGGLLLVRKTRP
jgi:hypothetical protein